MTDCHSKLRTGETWLNGYDAEDGFYRVPCIVYYNNSGATIFWERLERMTPPELFTSTSDRSRKKLDKVTQNELALQLVKMAVNLCGGDVYKAWKVTGKARKSLRANGAKIKP